MKPEKGIQRAKALKAAHDAVLLRAPDLSFDSFEEICAGGDVYPVEVSGAVVGAVVVIGNEIHASVKPEGFRRWFRKSYLQLLDSIAATYGCAVTRVSAGNAAGHEFVRRLGFAFFSQHGDVVFYKRWNHGN